MLKPNESSLLQTAALHFREFSNVGRGYLTPDVISAHAQRVGMTEQWIGTQDGCGYGFTPIGFDAVAKLARSLRTGRTAGLRKANGFALEKAVATILCKKLAGREPRRLSPNDLAELYAGIAAWFDSHDVQRTHFVPCRITPYAERPFRIGPVTFISRSLFAAEEDSLAAASQQDLGVRTFGVVQMLEFMDQSHSDWIAKVEVSGHEPKASAEAGDLMVDVALGALQLVVPRSRYEGVGRTTGRVAPVFSRSLVRRDGRVESGASNRQPGLTVSQGGFTEFVQSGEATLLSAGRRMSGFLDGSSENPRIDDAWCNAAYWFHLAMSESVPTVALTQIETAIEVLMRSGSSKGSISRFVEALNAFFDLQEDDVIPGSQLTAKQFAVFVVGSRSQVLHGTWSTLDVDLPEGHGGALISSEYVLSFGRRLLIAVSLAVDAFAATGAKDVGMAELIRWKINKCATANNKVKKS